MERIQVVILAAGNASRLLPITLSYPKPLLSLGGKPAMFNMLTPLVNKGVRDITFVVNNENKRLIQSTIERVYGNLNININYIIQENAVGPGNAFAMCEKYINGPTLLLLGDTICDIDNDYCDNWVGVYKISDDSHSQWCMVYTDEEMFVEKFIDKPKEKCNTDYAIIGTYFFKNPKLLRDSMNKANQIKEPTTGELQISLILNNYMKEERIKIKTYDTWYDIGTLENYSKAIKSYFHCRCFNTVMVDDDGILLKNSTFDGIKHEIEWYKDVNSKNISYIAPRFFGEVEGNNGYKMEYLDYPILSEFFVYYPIRRESWEYIFSSLLSKMKNLWDTTRSGENIEKQCEFMYKEKTFSRINKWNRSDLLGLDYYYINGQKIMGFNRLIKELDPYINNLIKSSNNYASYIHGDLSFANILYSPRTTIFKLIDPRGNFGEVGLNGDLRYDIAKLRHCYHGHYDVITSDLFEVKESKLGDILLEIYPKDLPDYDLFDEQIRKMGIDCDDIELIEGLLFISMIPLHSDSPNRQLAFFATGLTCLYNQYMKRERSK